MQLNEEMFKLLEFGSDFPKKFAYLLRNEGFFGVGLGEGRESSLS